jgi:hypothetical protein
VDAIGQRAISGEGPISKPLLEHLGKELNIVPSGASHQTGTMQFIAIEVLQGKGRLRRGSGQARYLSRYLSSLIFLGTVTACNSQRNYNTIDYRIKGNKGRLNARILN